jgi:vacuolar-type H+-ATPase subunit I/STV1
VQKTRSLARGEEDPRPDKQSAFADWKAHEGQAFEEDFEKNRAELRERKEEMRVALTTANAKKREIDEAKERLDRKQADKAMDPSGRDEELIDEEEYALIKSLKETKLQYREAFETHKRVRTEVMQVERSIQQCKSKLVQAFEEWYDLQYGQAQRAKAAELPQGDKFDSQEMFDLMEAGRIETQHPDALAFHNARKNAARDVRQKKAVPARVGR